MKLFVLFVLVCFVAGILFRKRGYKTNLGLMFVIALLVSIGYFFFNQV